MPEGLKGEAASVRKRMTKKTGKEMEIRRIDRQDYSGLLTDVTKLLEQARHTAARSVNIILTGTYWEIGRRIVEFEQGGKDRASYGEGLLRRLSNDLVELFGRGFGLSNLKQIRKFYLTYHARGKSQTLSGFFPIAADVKKSQMPSDLLLGEKPRSHPDMTILQTVPGEFPLPWSHYVRLLGLDEQAKRDFYEEEARRAGWSVRQLDRQINAMLYERVALSTLLFILCSEKDEAVAHYALGRLTNKIFASRYKLQLPDPEILTREIEIERRRLEMRLRTK